MILLESEYYKKWYEFCDLEESSKTQYTSYLRKFENFLIQSGFQEEEKLDFNKFYYIEDTGEYEGINVEFIDKFVDALKNEGISGNTLFNIIVGIKSFFTFLETIGLAKSPLNNYPNPYYNDTQRDRALSFEQCNLMLRTAFRMDPFFRQYYVLILFMIVCGLRASEVCGLKKSQLIFEHNMIKVIRGQKTSENTTFITNNLNEELRRYLNHPCWQNWSNGEDKEVFFHNNKPLYPRKLNRIIKEIVNEAGIKRKVTAHDLRYTTGSLLLEKGVNIKSIQRQLRHKKLTTTLHYLPPSIEIREALECYTDDID